MLEQLETVYRDRLQLEQTTDDEAKRLLSIIDDLRWYASRIDIGRWNEMPRPNKWSFEQNLWRLTKQAKSANSQGSIPVCYLIDCGKKCVGQASEIIALFEYSDIDS
jgi:hypothetical protein